MYAPHMTSACHSIASSDTQVCLIYEPLNIPAPYKPLDMIPKRVQYAVALFQTLEEKVGHVIQQSRDHVNTQCNY